MKLDVKAARKNLNTDLPFHFVVKADDMDLRGEIAHGDVVIEGSYVCTGECIILKGEIKADVEYTCGRCLEQATAQLTIPVREEFAWESDPDQWEINVIEGDWIELADLVQDYILLEMSYKNLCTAGCKGLCPQCGTNLNHSSCLCEN
jgi:uncharacterized protein